MRSAPSSTCFPHDASCELVGELNRDQFAHRSLSKQGVIVSCFLGLLGIAMTIYLTLFLTQPLHALHATFAGVVAGK